MVDTKAVLAAGGFALVENAKLHNVWSTCPQVVFLVAAAVRRNYLS